MIVNEPNTRQLTDQERREVARQRAMAKLQQSAIDAELQQMAKEDEERAKAAEVRAEAERAAEARKIQRLAELRPKYVQRAELAREIVRLVAQFIDLDVELFKAQDEILGRPRIGTLVGLWQNYVRDMRQGANLLPAHEQLGIEPPATNSDAVGVVVASGIVNGNIGPGFVRVGEHYARWDLTRTL